MVKILITMIAAVVISLPSAAQQERKFIRGGNQQVTFDEIKNEIIEIYCNIQYQLKLLKLALETITLYNAEYQVAELDYINDNNNTNRLLSDIKNSQTAAQIEYEKIINELNIMFLKLEIISNVQFRNK